MSQKAEILNAKGAKDLRKERKVLVLKDLFFANFAKNLCVFALKKLLIQPYKPDDYRAPQNLLIFNS